MSQSKGSADTPAFVIGAQKAGTSTVHDVLSTVGARTARMKETHYFSDDDRHARGVEWYDAQFVGADDTPRVEIDPAYLLSCAAPVRIRDHFSEPIRYAVILRDPYDRALSHYRMAVARGIEARPFLDAIRSEVANEQPIAYPQSADVAYIGGSQYVRHLDRWHHELPDAKRLVLDFDALVERNEQASWDALFDFIGIERVQLETLPQTNSAFVPRSRLLNRFLFDRSGFGGTRRLLHAMVPSERIRDRAATFLYSRNRNAAPPAENHVDPIDAAAARALVRQHVGYTKSDIAELMGEVSWPTLQPAGDQIHDR